MTGSKQKNSIGAKFIRSSGFCPTFIPICVLYKKDEKNNEKFPLDTYDKVRVLIVLLKHTRSDRTFFRDQLRAKQDQNDCVFSLKPENLISATETFLNKILPSCN